MFTKSGDCIRFSDKIQYLGVFLDKHMYLDRGGARSLKSLGPQELLFKKIQKQGSTGTLRT